MEEETRKKQSEGSNTDGGREGLLGRHWIYVSIKQASMRSNQKEVAAV